MAGVNWAQAFNPVNVAKGPKGQQEAIKPGSTTKNKTASPKSVKVTKDQVVSYLTSQGIAPDLAKKLWDMAGGGRESLGLATWLSAAKSAETLVAANVDISQYKNNLGGLSGAAQAQTTAAKTAQMTALGVTQADVDDATALGIDLLGTGGVAAYTAAKNQAAITESAAKYKTLLAGQGYTPEQLNIFEDLLQEYDPATALQTMQTFTGQQAASNVGTASPYYWAQQWQAQNPGGGNAPAPAWLTALTPGLKTGAAISAQGQGMAAGMPGVLSTQGWATMPLAQKEALGGYLNWAYGPEAESAYAAAVKRRAPPGGGTTSPWGSSSWL